MSKGFKWSLLLILLGVLGCMFVPWLFIMFPTWSCTKDEINIKTGQGRHSRFIAFIRVSQQTFDTPLSLALTGAVDVARIREWHAVTTFSPPSERISPTYYFRGALSQAQHAGYLFEQRRASPEQQTQLATQILTAWQTTGRSHAADALLWKMPPEKTNRPIDQVPGPIPPQGGRLAFARAISTLQVGMSAKQALGILGAPQDVRTQNDPGGIDTFHTKEIWGYGTDGHLTFPTLGCVYMDDEDKVQYIYGGKGTPPAPAVFAEAEARTLLRLIDKLPRADGVDYNPRDFIRVVNRLHGLGKEKALAIIDEYLRVASEHFKSTALQGLFLVLRILFDVPADPGYMPRMLIGAPQPEDPEDPKLIPRFPVLIQDDIPLMLVVSYSLGGCPQPAEDHVRYFRRYGNLRDRPLLPTNAPLAVLDKLEHSPQWIYGKPSTHPSNAAGRTLLINQLLRLVDTVYRIPLQPYGIEMPSAQWAQIREEFDKLGARWDGQKNGYVFADGTQLPEIKTASYRRNIWPLPTLGPEAQVVIERTGPREIKSMVDYGEGRGLRIAGATLRVVDLSAPDKPLMKTMMHASPAGSSCREYVSGIKLPAGARVQAELVSGAKRWQSPVYIP